MTTDHTDIDVLYMQRCLDLALLGIQNAAPNPMVGSVIVHDNQIIGEGYHERYGEAHAEVNAINSVKDKSLLNEATLYVNLEPCAHYGKTPPCSLLIVQHQIKRVVVGCIDPFAKVAGKGIKIMEDAGIEVKVGVLEKESLQLNRRFVTFHEKKRPYIILKWAESLDGYIDSNKDTPTWLTNEESRVIVHKMRAEEAAIMVGKIAAKKDNPSLTTRVWEGPNPVRVTLDKKLKLPTTHHLFDGNVPTLIFTEKEKQSSHNLEYVTINFKENVLEQCMAYLYEQNLTSLIVEGGEILLNSFINAGLWDEAWQFIGTIVLQSGTSAPVLKATPQETIMVDNVKLNTYYKG